EYVDFDLSPEELADKLTFSGTEVESIDEIGAGLDAIVVAEVLAIEPHPGADRLLLCKVNTGSGECAVVCGASNFKVGDKVPFAGIGVRLPSGMKIKKAKIRGELSEGMLCAEDELGLSDDHVGIMILSSDAEPGASLPDAIGPPETVLTLEVTWNRSDCLSIMGIAREVAAMLGTTLKLPDVEFEGKGGAVDTDIKVAVEDAVACPRYTALVLSKLKMGPSPDWMRRRLSLCGVRPISNVVDITNYVMLETGQPLHAFDHSLLTDGQIIVRRAKAGERIATLDDEERELDSDMLVIADTKGAVALAGVMGGAGSEITDKTEKVLLESACFDPAVTHRTVLATGLTTESSHRFERGVDVSGVDWAGRRAALLMVEHAGATISKGMVDVYPGKCENRVVRCRYERARDLLGVAISDDRMVVIMEALELPVIDSDAESFTVEVPSFRRDLVIEADLIEEIVRLYGLSNIPAKELLAKVVAGADDIRPRAVDSCRDVMIGLGLNEVLHYSFLSAELLDLFSRSDRGERVVLPNPVSADYAVMRNSLIPQMVETLGRNASRQVADAAFFEIGQVFLRSEEGVIREEQRLCIGLMGRPWHVGLGRGVSAEPDEMFLRLKGIAEELFRVRCLHPDDGSGQAMKEMEHPYFTDSTGLSMLDGDSLFGIMGLVRELIRARWRITGPVGVAEISMNQLVEHVSDIPSPSPIPAFPGVVRDMALIVDEAVTHDSILEIVKKIGQKELTSIALFDIFCGGGIERGKKSLAYSIIYRSLERTLTDDEVNGYHLKVKEALKSGLKVEIREG
ncbi:MAG: phenylalanine--tRNA ligase subunit beta, partial [Kiritimatiellae bacterium]|nr:phenylalanine--tRNA ligase subunit beta [Kiritimatiellia bacterium]